jgi:hypothetical protein
MTVHPCSRVTSRELKERAAGGDQKVIVGYETRILQANQFTKSGLKPILVSI